MTELMDPAAVARTLIESVHADGADLAAEQPLVFDERHAGRILWLGEQDEVDSACTCLVRDFVIGETRIRGGLIGSVATRPSKRGRGLASRLMERAEEELVREGCLFSLLWADVPEFYGKLDYAPMAGEVDFLVPRGVSALFPVVPQVRPIAAGDVEGVHRLYTAHPVRVERTLDETAALLACPDMRTLVLEREGAVVAYACLGRGRDLQGAIHEWGGAPRDVLALVRAHAEERPAEDALFFMAPTTSVEICYHLTVAGAISKHGVLGMGKILNRAAAASLLRERLGAEARVEVHEDGVFLGGPADEGVLPDDALLAVLFSSPEALNAVHGLLSRFGLPLEGLPLQPFAWGLDSI